MQTFLPFPDPYHTAVTLDRLRLGKQRVEAIQITQALLGIRKGWSKHPVTKMWKGYEGYLVRVYLKSIMEEWVRRGYNNEKCQQHYDDLVCLVPEDESPPGWLTEEFCEQHRKLLFDKNPEFYSYLREEE